MQIEELYKRYTETGKVSTDSRQITPGSVFFALKGPRHNANEFAAEALARGASCAVVDEESYARGKEYVLVKDGLHALQLLAKYHRSQLTIPFLALTGSNGKTTTKELVHAVLSRKLITYSTKGNLNNHIGVPITVLGVGREAEIAVIEMGANHVGEIAALCDIANPTHGFITNIGKAHLGTFGGLEGIVRGKSELFQHLLTTGGTPFINSQNPVLANMAKRFKSPVFYPAKGDYYHCEPGESDPFLTVITEDGEPLQTQLVGRYNFENVAAALCVGKYFGVDRLESNRAISSYSPDNMRSQVIRKGSNTIILDAYNANPSSMAAAIENLAAMKAGKKVLILGDMLELEGEAEKEHSAIGKLIREKGFEEVYLCGFLFKPALREIPFARHFETKQQLMDALETTPIQSSTILVKASRGIGLEGVMKLL